MLRREPKGDERCRDRGPSVPLKPRLAPCYCRNRPVRRKCLLVSGANRIAAGVSQSFPGGRYACRKRLVPLVIRPFRRFIAAECPGPWRSSGHYGRRGRRAGRKTRHSGDEKWQIRNSRSTCTIRHAEGRFKTNDFRRIEGAEQQGNLLSRRNSKINSTFDQETVFHLWP